MKKYQVEPWSVFKMDQLRSHGWREEKDKQSGKAIWIWKRKWVHKVFHDEVDACLAEASEAF